MDNFLTIENLSKRYHDLSGEVSAIEGLNLSFKKGEFVAVVGPSGCGKSSLLSLISSLDNDYTGTVNFKVNKPRIGYMLQRDSLFPWRNILDNACLGLEVYKEKIPANVNRVIELLKTYGLEDFTYKYPSSLSGGMRQRVGR